MAITEVSHLTKHSTTAWRKTALSILQKLKECKANIDTIYKRGMESDQGFKKTSYDGMS